LKFLIIGDLHGKRPRIHYKNFDAIIVPGDICSDRGLRGIMLAWIRSWKSKNVKSWEEFFKKIDKKKFRQYEKDSLKAGWRILKFLNSFGKPVFLVPGNWDQSFGKSKIKDEDKDQYSYLKSVLDKMDGETNKHLKKGLKNIYDCQFKLHRLPDFNIIGYGLSNFPEKKFTQIKNKKLAERLRRFYKKLFKKLSDQYKKRDKSKPTIFLSHNVPHNTRLDKILKKDSPIYGEHYGSTITREFCKKYRPLICIGGHMHEHFGKDKIGKTVVVNVGFGPRVNTLLEIKGNKIHKLKFHKGKKR